MMMKWWVGVGGGGSVKVRLERGNFELLIGYVVSLEVEVDKGSLESYLFLLCCDYYSKMKSVLLI